MLSRTTHLLLDKGRRIIGVLAGCPKDKGWEDVCSSAFLALDRVAQKVVSSKKDIETRRGVYPSITYGISLGNGIKVGLTLLTSLLWVA